MTAVLYHDGCPDGWCAAWVAYNALKDQEGIVPELVPVNHGQDPPELAHDRVYIVDFAYPHQVLVEMAADREVVVLDHHRTAIDEICSALGMEPKTGPYIRFTRRFPYQADFDTTRSGAGITWDHFHPDRPRPDVVNYVEDRDLMQWSLPRSRAVNAYLKALPRSLGAWDDVATHLGVGDMAATGAGVLMQIEAYARAAATQAYWCLMGGERFPIVNITYESCSDVAEHLLDVFDTDMAGYFFQRADGLWQYGFRGRGDRSVRELAERFGGGGHDQAAGCQVPEPVHSRAGQ